MITIDDISTKLEHIMEADPRSFHNRFSSNNEYFDLAADIYLLIRELYGSWIVIDGEYRCGRCGSVVQEKTKFCPHCGGLNVG